MLRLRIASALVLAPLVLVAVWFGSWTFAALVGAAGVLLAWEWTRLSLGRFGVAGILLGAMAGGVATLALVRPMLGLALIAVAAVLAPVSQRVAGRSLLWAGGGAFYIGLPVLALVWLRGEGAPMVYWLLSLVWATDIGAYAAGRVVGGPKLLPRISPKKTWAGLVGGVFSAAAVGAIAALLTEKNIPTVAGLSGMLAVVAQTGDFAESWMKRHFGVKDSSGIIPGHGGVMDRLDGLLAAAPVVGMLHLLYEGGLPQ